MRGDALYSVEFDADTLSPRGEPRLVVPSVQSGASTLIGQYATGGGRLLYLPGQNTAAKPLIVVEYRGITGGPRLLISDPGTYRDLRFSPDGQRLAYSAWVPVTADATDLFVYDLQRDVKIRLAGDPTAEWRPVWTSDGQVRRVFGLPLARAFERHEAHSRRRIGPARTIDDGDDRRRHAGARVDLAGWEVPRVPGTGEKPTGGHLDPSDESCWRAIPLLHVARERHASGVFPGWTMDRLCVGRVGRERALHPAVSEGRRQVAGVELRDLGRTRVVSRWQEVVLPRRRRAAPHGGGDFDRRRLADDRPRDIHPHAAGEDYPELGFWGGLALSPDDRGFALAKYASEIVGTRNRVVLMLDWIDPLERTGARAAPR